MKTFSANKDAVERNWYLIDAKDKVLGRIAVEIARRLRGKHKPIYTPHADAGDFIIVVNAEKIALTGKKLDDKFYYRHTGYPGGIKSVAAGKLQRQKPGEILKIAVKGMLPKNSLGRMMLKKLKVYAGSDHPHEAQRPQPLEI
ncbi:MAG: 50S ribosomal protein L13 [Syntrophobacterales bacterium]|jgi:large subunit ribosomal protein L13|nr:50S ribosomal protein L13 [Syntrophobacterales bacterium]